MTRYRSSEITENGRTLIHPAWAGGQEGWRNFAFPDVRDVDTVQKYPVGTKLQDGERVWYYCGSKGVTNADTGVENSYQQHVAYATVAAAAAKGDTSLTIDVANTDGAAADGEIAANELAGGFVVIFGHDSDASTHRILENTAVAAGGGEMTLTLQDEINATLVADADHAECIASFFAGVADAGHAEKPIVGVAQSVAASGTWLWVQTWGPVWIPPQAAVGDAAHDMQVVFRHDGSVDEHDYNDANVAKQQHAGFTMAHANGGGQGAAFIMLQICP